MITQERVKELLDYDPITGWLIWIKKRSGVRLYHRAGYISVNGRYRQIKIDNIIYYEHNIIWLWITGKFPRLVIDHEDRNGLNNKWKNLREVTKQKDLLNRRKYGSVKEELERQRTSISQADKDLFG
jgi:HNH endonuclease